MSLDNRNKFQIGFSLITNSYFYGFLKGKIYTGNLKNMCVPGLNCYSCPGALGSCPLGSIQNAFAGTHNKLSLYLIGVFLLFGAAFGRLVCGFMCPFGLLQDLIYKIKVFKMKKVKNMPFHNILKYLKYVILLVFVILLPLLLTNKLGMSSPYFCKLICPSGTFMAGIPLALTNKGIASAIGKLFTWKLFLLIIFFGLSLKFYRPFCKYICPLGAIYGFFNPIAIYKFEVRQDKCINCKRCQKVCPMDIKTYKTPNSMDCIRCNRCLKVCPTEALIRQPLIEKQKCMAKN